MSALKLKSLLRESAKSPKSMSDDELITQLLTTDYQGKNVKEECLRILFEKMYSDGYADGITAQKATHAEKSSNEKI